MVKYRVVDGEEAKPVVGDILGDGGAQPPERGDVVQETDEQRPDHDFRMHCGSPIVGTVVFLQWRNQLGKNELLVDLD